MTAKSIPNPEEKGKKGNEEIQNPEVPEKGTESDLTLKKELKADKLPAEPVDYKKKFSDSSREAQRLNEEAKLKDGKITELEAELREQKRNATPSDEELKKEYPDYEYLDDSGKEKLKKDAEREKRLRRVEEQLAWESDFKSLAKKPEFVSLKKREEEFRDFAYDHIEVKDLKILAQSFLFGEGIRDEEEPKAPPSRSGLEKPTKGPVEVPATGLTLAQIKLLREEQPRRYAKMIREGRLNKIPEK